MTEERKLRLARLVADLPRPLQSSAFWLDVRNRPFKVGTLSPKEERSGKDAAGILAERQARFDAKAKRVRKRFLAYANAILCAWEAS